MSLLRVTFIGVSKRTKITISNDDLVSRLMDKPLLNRKSMSLEFWAQYYDPLSLRAMFIDIAREAGVSEKNIWSTKSGTCICYQKKQILFLLAGYKSKLNFKEKATKLIWFKRHICSAWEQLQNFKSPILYVNFDLFTTSSTSGSISDTVVDDKWVLKNFPYLRNSHLTKENSKGSGFFV